MDRITATEFARNLSDFLNRVRYRDESFVIERNREPVAVVHAPTLSAIAQQLGGLAWPDDGFTQDLLWARDRRSRA